MAAPPPTMSSRCCFHANVTELDLSKCSHVADACAAAISRNPITSLNVSWCSTITEISHCPLTSLNLLLCHWRPGAGKNLLLPARHGGPLLLPYHE